MEVEADEVTCPELQGQARVGIWMEAGPLAGFWTHLRFNDHLHEATCLTVSTEEGKPAQAPGVATGLPWARCDCPGASAGTGAFPGALGNRQETVPRSLWGFRMHLAPCSGFGEQLWLLAADSRACLLPASLADAHCGFAASKPSSRAALHPTSPGGFQSDLPQDWRGGPLSPANPGGPQVQRSRWPLVALHNVVSQGCPVSLTPWHCPALTLGCEEGALTFLSRTSRGRVGGVDHTCGVTFAGGSS